MSTNTSFRRVKEMAMRRVNGLLESEDKDFLAAEEPLEIRVEGHSVAVVMRTPGEDRELAVGFLVTEGIVHQTSDIVDVRHVTHCSIPARSDGSPESLPVPGMEPNLSDGNIINVHLRDSASLDLKKLTRHVFTSSSCGICSKSSIDAVRQQFPPLVDFCEVEPQVLMELPALLAAAQETFKRTGGLHACALFDMTGNLLVLREDVGRHNALDKVIGWALLEDRLPLNEHIILLSGRTSFEMLQKSLAAGIPVVAAISAPSSLAVEFARESGQTLIGFLRGEKMNIYSGADRVRKFSSSNQTDALPVPSLV